MMTHEVTDEFGRDFKRLLKKYRTLEEDLKVAKKNAIELRYIHDVDNGAIFEIPGYCSEHIKIAKLKKFACRSLPGSGVRSGIRIIFAFHSVESKVVLLEIYHKSDKENEDRNRITTYLRR